MNFTRRDPFFGVTIITGPRSVYLLLAIRGERTETPRVVPLGTVVPRLSMNDSRVRDAVLEGTDEANAGCCTAFHPAEIKFAMETWAGDYSLLRRAARAIVERLATQGPDRYAGTVSR